MPGNNNGENKIVFEIPYDAQGKFRARDNRFLGRFSLDGKTVYVHIHDPGRLEELLKNGNEVLLKKYNKKGRRTKWEVIAAKFRNNWIFTNSKFHSAIARKIIEDPKISPLGKVDKIYPEIKVGESRLDFLILRKNEKIWVEVKGCTLMEENIALFPDAPTVRGKRHVEELIKLREKGDRAALIFLVFHNAKCFSPNEERDENFAKKFYRAIKEGVEIYPIHLSYDGNFIYYHGVIPVCEKNQN